MSDTRDDPLLGLLTDIADGIAALSARLDAVEASNSAHQTQANEALATIAEIATGIYHVSKPPSALPDDVINADVPDAMIARWPTDALVTMSSLDRKIMIELDPLPGERIHNMIAHAQNSPDESTANKLRRAAFLTLLNEERERRLKVNERDTGRDGRSR